MKLSRPQIAIGLVSTALLCGAPPAMRSHRQRVLNARLINAIRAECPADVASLLAKGADPDAQEPDDRSVIEKMVGLFTPPPIRVTGTAMLDALFSNKVGLPYSERKKQIIRLLVDKGADVNKTGSGGFTPLMAASFWGDSETVKTLISAHANVKAADIARRTPLFYAANDTITRSLLAAHANVNVLDKDGSSPLIVARSARSVTALLSAGADINARDKRGDTPLNASAYRDDADSVRTLLVAGAHVNVADNDGLTPMVNATHRGNAAIVKMLIAAHAETNIRNKYGRTALTYAILSKRHDLIAILKAAGAKE